MPTAAKCRRIQLVGQRLKISSRWASRRRDRRRGWAARRGRSPETRRSWPAARSRRSACPPACGARDSPAAGSAGTSRWPRRSVGCRRTAWRLTSTSSPDCSSTSAVLGGVSRLRSSMSVSAASTPSSHAASPSSDFTCRSGGELSRVNQSQSSDFGRRAAVDGEIGLRRPTARSRTSSRLFRRGVGQDVLPVPGRGVEVAAHVDQRAVRLSPSASPPATRGLLCWAARSRRGTRRCSRPASATAARARARRRRGARPARTSRPARRCR